MFKYSHIKWYLLSTFIISIVLFISGFVTVFMSCNPQFPSCDDKKYVSIVNNRTYVKDNDKYYAMYEFVYNGGSKCNYIDKKIKYDSIGSIDYSYSLGEKTIILITDFSGKKCSTNLYALYDYFIISTVLMSLFVVFSTLTVFFSLVCLYRNNSDITIENQNEIQLMYLKN